MSKQFIVTLTGDAEDLTVGEVHTLLTDDLDHSSEDVEVMHIEASTWTSDAKLIVQFPFEFALGWEEADGMVGVTYDDDPDSPRSRAYDLGRTAKQCIDSLDDAAGTLRLLDEIANTIIKLPEVKELLKLQQKAEQDAAKAPHFTPPRPGDFAAY